ncbi:hypothetical protein GCM10010399_18930 [Dactylosporangium fulvum]|uniref:Lipoprotein n=1 Tax=Dactylosporangium fulvum TaxID=53359 RepID=A0ABY5W333_9ACTN|nr:hypothetical protein [Dactylosporangium fulvum]UWP83790.1 hypothetical protein Dfulv_05890 [Dactylosporangium fulvum]
MRRLVLALVLTLSLGGCGWAGRHDEKSKPDGFLLHGYVSVAGAAAGTGGTPCLAPPSASDIAAGAPVRAADADGKVIAVTSLGGGVLAATPDGFHCNFGFELSNLSGSRPTYRIQVADRPPQSFETKPLREGKEAVVPVDGPAGPTASPSPS